MMIKKIKRELCLLLAVVFLLSLPAGCSDVSNVTLNADSSGSYEEVLTVSKNVWDLCVGDLGSEDSIAEYYKNLYPQASVAIEENTSEKGPVKTLRLNMNFKNADEFQQLMSSMDIMSVKFNTKYFSRTALYMPLEEEDASAADELAALLGEDTELAAALKEELQDMDVKMTIAFPYAVKKANGTIQEDGKTVVWGAEQIKDAQRLYALFASQTSKSAPVFSGAANGKNYNTGVTLKINSANLLNKVVVNGETTQADYLFLSAEGVYTITASDVNKNSSKIKFRIDTTKPAVSGAANGKTYTKARTIKFSDKGSGIKKAVLNGRTIKSGTRVSKKGSYSLTVTDKAGNKKTVKFKIK